MCGIGGLWFLNGQPVERSLLDGMAALLSRRGPDGQGIHCDGSLGLAHARLAILDRSEAGCQPMTDAEGRYHITYNGEIYNFLELRTELESFGCRFRSDTDTEVVLAAYAQWGEACQLRFNGVWAFAIWDSLERRLFLSRDRFGVRPLHYRRTPTSFSFASEMKAFLAVDDFAADLDPAVTARAIIDFGAIEGTEDCLFQGVRRLCGGHSLTVEASGRISITRWWNTALHVRRLAGSEDDLTAQFRDLFFDACRIRMRSDVPLATALSGGLDSSAVHAVIAALGRQASTGAERRAPDWQTAFIAGFGNSPYDERSYAEAMVGKAGTIARIREMQASEAAEICDRVFFDTEDIYDILTGPWLIYREMRRNGFAVSLDGHGGDELLAGYHHYYHAALASREPPLDAAELRGTVETMTVPALHGRPALPPLPDKRTVLTVEAAKAAYPNAAAPEELAGWDMMTRMMYGDFHTRVLPSILRNFDRASMAHGVEIRAPFMDWRLVCFCFGLPIRAKIRDGYSKAILRRAIGDLLPDEVRTRKSKMGFVSPTEDWISGPLLPYIMDWVGSRDFLDSPIWDGKAVRTIMEDAVRLGQPHMLRWGWEFINAARIQATFRDWRTRAPSAEMIA